VQSRDNAMVNFTKDGIRIGREELPLYSGAFHYWRSPRSAWKRILSRIRSMGFGFVETYIPWIVHEPQEGCFDFGEKVPEKDLDAFLSLCEELGLCVIVRPGPHINAEMVNFGFPDWVVCDTEMTAKNPWGTEVVYPYVTGPFAIPSYASEKFYTKVRNYFLRLQPILRKHAYPEGSIVAIQADNETCNFFRDNPFIMDYSGESIAQYHRFLRERFRSVTEMNRKTGTGYGYFREARAPEGLTDSNFSECILWVRFKEFQILASIARIAGLIDEMKLNIPVFQNCAYQTYSPISVQRDENLPGIDAAGMDLYCAPGDTATIRERILFLSGSCKLCFVPEFGSGSYWDEGFILSPGQQEFGYLYAFMHGMKAVNFYMLVERERWTACPIRNDGSIRKNYYHSFKRMLRFLHENEIWKDRRQARVLILKNYEMGRIRSVSEKGGFTSLNSNCFVQPFQLRKDELKQNLPAEVCADRCPDPRFEDWILMVMQYLGQHQIDYDLSDEYLPTDRIEKYDYVFASMYPLEEEEYPYILQRYAKGRNHHLIFGPYQPAFDESSATLGAMDCGRLVRNEEELKEAGEGSDLLKASGRIHCTMEGSAVSGQKVEMIWQKCGMDRVWHQYIANTGKDIAAVTLTYSRQVRLKGIWNSRRNMQGTKLKLHIQPMDIAIFEIREADQ
jgi:beta-galactosidase